MTHFPELFQALAAPFGRGQVKTRAQGGKQMPYITARTVMNRFDEVLGPENWWDDYIPCERSVTCRLSIRLPDGQILTKVDAGGYAGLADPGDDDKSGFADAFKRTAIKFGVGRELYGDGVARLSGPTATTSAVATPPPAAPARLVKPEPPVDRKPQVVATVIAGAEDAQGRGGRAVYGQSAARTPSRPKTGLDLYLFAKDCQDDPQLVSWIAQTFSGEDAFGYPAKIVDWTPGQVTDAWPSIREHLVTLRSRAKLAVSA